MPETFSEVPRKIADHCKRVLDLANAKLSEEFFYNSLALCVIDAVFSLGISYTATRNVVKNFCSKLKIKMFRHHGSPPEANTLKSNLSFLWRRCFPYTRIILLKNWQT